MPFNLATDEETDGSWSFVDKGGQPIVDETLLVGWSATFESSSPGVVEVLPLESNPESVLGKTVRAGALGQSVVTSVLTGPEGQTFTGSETISVINAAPDHPVFTFGSVRKEDA